MSQGPCKCKKEECEECPEWIFTFADLVMLMMGFFVVLWVLKPAPSKTSASDGDAQWTKIAAAIREAFDYLPNPKSSDPVDIEMLRQKIAAMKPLNGPGDGGKTKIKRQGAEGTDPETTKIRPGPVVGIGGRILFDAGSAKLNPVGIHMLDDVIAQIKGFRNIIQVKGHTSLDDLPESASAETKMDLSLRRAQAVADYMTRSGVSPDTIRVQGCSTFEPVAQRAYTDDTRGLNRRVEIEVTAMLVSQRQDQSDSGTAQPLPNVDTPPQNGAASSTAPSSGN